MRHFYHYCFDPFLEQLGPRDRCRNVSWKVSSKVLTRLKGQLPVRKNPLWHFRFLLKMYLILWQFDWNLKKYLKILLIFTRSPLKPIYLSLLLVFSCPLVFHKTEIQTVILRWGKVLNLNRFKTYDIIAKKARNEKKAKKTANGNICVLGRVSV